MHAKIFFPLIIMILLLIVDSFLMNELTLEQVNMKFPEFSTVDFNGNAVSEDIFNGKVTVLCIWSTNYEQCADLLRALEDMNKTLPPEVQIIGLFGEKEVEIARSMAIKNSPSITQILANDDLIPLLSKIKMVPTTILIDAQSNLVGQPIIGAEINLIRQELTYLLEKDSPRNKSLRKVHSILFL